MSARTMSRGGQASPGGGVSAQVVRPLPWAKVDAFADFRPALAHFGLPVRGLAEEVNDWRSDNAGNLLRSARKVALARALHLPTLVGAVWLRRIAADGEITDFGLGSMAVVTTAGVGYLVDALQNLVEPELLKFHGIGTGTTAEAAADTALVTELTTQYNPDSTRATGSLTEGASANIFRTVGTNAVDSAVAITEHGIFTQAATGGGTLLDRSVFSAVNLASGDSLQTTYDLTIPSGG